MEEGGPSFGKKFSETCRHVIHFFKSQKKGHIGVIPHHHTIMGTKREVQDRCGRSVEVEGGDLGGGRVRGELAPFVFIFPSHLPNKGKNAQIQKNDQRWKI